MIGSSSECTFVLSDDTVSRHHCEVVATAEGVTRLTAAGLRFAYRHAALPPGLTTIPSANVQSGTPF